MLYPKKYIKSKENKILEKIDYIKECFFVIIMAFKSYNSFVLFLKQKLHF